MATQEKNCPVCGEDFERGTQVKAQGRNMEVCCDDCADKVRENPSRYAETSDVGGSTARGGSPR